MKKPRERILSRTLKEKISEAMTSVMPIIAIVIVLTITVVPLSPGPVVLFLFGALLLIFGMSLFTMGVDMSMIPMGEGIGVSMAKAKHKLLPMLLCLVLGVLITIAEPDLTVLADQVTAINKTVMIISVAVGVGLFLLFSLLRTSLKIPLRYILLVFYTLAFISLIFVPSGFWAVVFDASGVTTGPITVPFIMALGIGMASVKMGKNSQSDSFGIVAMCSVGPIVSVIILGIVFQPTDVTPSEVTIDAIVTVKDAARFILEGLPEYLKEVVISLAPIAGVFLVFELATRRFKKHQLIRIISGFVYTYVGLVLFMTGVNVGFMPVGYMLGSELGASPYNWLLVPIGMLVGYFIVAAEPAVHVLKKQVEEVSNGSITQRAMGIALSVGVMVSVGLAMLRILTGISILWFLIPGYTIALAMTFFVPDMFTGVAFDAGGVASGPMTATFLLPLAMGVCTVLGGDAFGIVAMVAMTPLVTIQVLGFTGIVKKRIANRNYELQLSKADNTIVYFD